MALMNGKGPGDKVAKAAKKVEKGLSLKQREKGLAAAKGLAKLDVLQKGLTDRAKKQVVKAAVKDLGKERKEVNSKMKKSSSLRDLK